MKSPSQTSWAETCLLKLLIAIFGFSCPFLKFSGFCTVYAFALVIVPCQEVSIRLRDVLIEFSICPLLLILDVQWRQVLQFRSRCRFTVPCHAWKWHALPIKAAWGPKSRKAAHVTMTVYWCSASVSVREGVWGEVSWACRGLTAFSAYERSSVIHTKEARRLGHVWGLPTANREDLLIWKGYRMRLKKAGTSSSIFPNSLGLQLGSTCAHPENFTGKDIVLLVAVKRGLDYHWLFRQPHWHPGVPYLQLKLWWILFLCKAVLWETWAASGMEQRVIRTGSIAVFYSVSICVANI